MAPSTLFVFTVVTLMVCVTHVSSQVSVCNDPCAAVFCASGHRCVNQHVIGRPCRVARCIPIGPSTGVKPGSCRRVPPGQVGTCIQQCTSDRSCPGNQKCCSNGCGVTCQDPVFP